MPQAPLTFDAPLALVVVASVLAAAATAIAYFRRINLPAGSKVLAVLGLLLLTAAAGQPQWRRPAAGEVAVLVDLSASTRTAGYRDRVALRQRIDELLVGTPHKLYAFAGGDPFLLPDGPPVDLPADRTVLAPPAAAAVLLFSDGRFALPASAPPTYAVVDPNLLKAADASVRSLRIDSDAAAHVESTTDRRSLTWTGTGGRPTDAVAPGAYVLRRPVAPGAAEVTARLSGGDAWPENDALTARPPPPVAAERWFVSATAAAPPGFTRVDPADLPADPAAYLSVAAVVLDNVPANRLSPVARQRLAQYVRDLGGGLLIVGGDDAFAAGAYVGTPIEAISPLASVPPRPATHWVLLTDASGSMASAASRDSTRWQAATSALARLLPTLPPDDPVDVGSFATGVAWWSTGRSAAETAALPLPPPGVAPTGQTNLEAAIVEAANRHDPALPGHLLVLSDADAVIADPAKLVALLKSRNLKLHVLAVSGGSGLADLERMATETGGRLVRQDDAARWADAAADILQAAGDRRLSATPADVTFAGPLASLPARGVAPWNRTFLKPRATELATAKEPAGDAVPMAASWQVGEGRAAAAAFEASADERAALVALVARPPRDPRLTVTWEAGATLHVRVDAVDSAAGQYLNGRPLVLDLSADGGGVERHPIVQVGPGRYELTLPAPASPRLATVRDDGRAVERFAVAGRYAAEFDAVGVDRASLDNLTRRFGGRVIEPDDHKPLEFKWPRREVPVTPWAATAGAAMIAAALVWWRRA